MGIRLSKRPVAARRIATLAERLLDASTLCAIATVAPTGRAHVNTAYFAWSPDFRVVWLSEPGAKHSKNLRANGSVAIAVYDSSQVWGKPDRGIQLFGRAEQVVPTGQTDFEELYAARFPDYQGARFSAYRIYVLKVDRLKLFDEHALGGGVFVTARIRGGSPVWERTEIYASSA